MAGNGAAHLSGHDYIRGNMLNLADGSSVASAQLLDDGNVFGFQVQPVLDANLKHRLWTLLKGGGQWLGSGSRQGEALDVFAFHGAHGEAIIFRHYGVYYRARRKSRRRRRSVGWYVAVLKSRLTESLREG